MKLGPKMVQDLQSLGNKLSLNFWLKTFKWRTCVDASDYGIFSAENLTNSIAHIDGYITGSRKILNKLHTAAFIQVFWKK